MRPMLSLVTGALAMSCAAFAPASAQSRPPGITAMPAKGWSLHTINLDSGGALVLLVGATAVGGRIAICGSGFTERSHSLLERLVPDIITDMRLRLDRTQLLQQAEDFILYPSEAEWRRAKGKAGCTLTRVAADPALLARPLTVELRTSTIYH